MFKKLLLTGLLALASSFSSSNPENLISASPSIPYSPPLIPKPRTIYPPEYSDFLKLIDPKTKLPDEKYLTDKPNYFESDDEGNYISKLYRFRDFQCSLYFAVDDMEYTEKENEIKIKLHKFPKYIKLEIPMFFQENYIDKEQDGIDGKNESIYLGEDEKESLFKNPKNFYCIPVDGENFPQKGNKLYSFLKNYLNDKGILDKESRTEKPVGMSFLEGRANILEDYFLEGKSNEKDMIADIIACTLYFPVNDASFMSKKDTDNILLKISKNPRYITLSKRRYHLNENSDNPIEPFKEFWYTNPKNGIDGDELYDNEYPNMKKSKKLEGKVI